MIHIIGGSHAPIIFRAAAQLKGIEVTDDINKAELVIISEDTPTDESGKRDTGPIVQHVYQTLRATEVPVILTSQVAPGFCRRFNNDRQEQRAPS